MVLGVVIVLASTFSLVWPSVSLWIRQKALEQYALGLCEDFPHPSGADCRQEVEKFARDCSRQFVSDDFDFDGYLACLGFDAVEPPTPAVVVGSCAGPDIIGSITFSLAKKEPWEGSAPRTFGDEVFHVASVPMVSTAEVLALRLEETEDRRSLELEFESAATSRFRDAMRQHVGEWMVVHVNGEERAARIIGTASEGFTLRDSGGASIHAFGARLEDLCRLP